MQFDKGEDNVTKYFNSLKRLWQDLDLFNDYEWKSTDDCNHYKKTVEDGRIFKFFIGLSVEFDEVRGRIIGRQSLPSIGEVFSEVRREESRRLVMLGKKNSGSAVENSVLAAGTNVGQNNSKKYDGKPRIWCERCKKPRHTIETCWKIHGKPANWNGSHEGRFNQSATVYEAEIVPFNKEQMDHLLKLLKSKSVLSGTPNASLSQTGSDSRALTSHSLTPWIIDSGASDHMTSFSHLFNTYTLVLVMKKFV